MTTFYVLSFLYLLGVVCAAPAIVKEVNKAKVGAWAIPMLILLWPIAVYVGLFAASYGKKK